MRYHVEDIEAQIIATLEANTTLKPVSGTGGCRTINTHAGEVNQQTFLNPAMQEGFVHLLPFVLVQYDGRFAPERDSTAQIYQHRIRFRLFVGASSLSQKRGGQLTAYEMLRAVFDSLHGKWPYSTQTLATGTPVLSGTQITTSGFNASAPLLEAGGDDERLIVNLPTIVCYQTDYYCRVMA